MARRRKNPAKPAKKIEQVLVEQVLGVRRARALHKKLLGQHTGRIPVGLSDVTVSRFAYGDGWFVVHRHGRRVVIHPRHETTDPSLMAWISLAIAVAGFTGLGCMSVDIDRLGEKHATRRRRTVGEARG